MKAKIVILEITNKSSVSKNTKGLIQWMKDKNL